MELHIPEGINYDCTGCGKCCGGWSVPLTKADYERISVFDWATEKEKFKGRQLFRKLRPAEKAQGPYSYAIKMADDGFCPFLVDNLCFIHSQKGATVKPAICQLFPYCFNETPSGIYLTVSFVSMAVCHNQGRALKQQREYLLGKYADFQALFPNHHPNWSDIKLTVGQPISWDEYLSFEEKIMTLLSQSGRFEERLLASSKYLTAMVKKSPASAHDSNQQSQPHLNQVDYLLLSHFHQLYFPDKPTSKEKLDFKLFRFIRDSIFSGQIKDPNLAGHRLSELSEIAWTDEPEVADLIYRYFYSRVFAKLYFGAGFAQLSLIAGFHHLILVYVLLKCQAKALALTLGIKQVGLFQVVTAIRQLEKRLGEITIGPYGAAILETLLFSPTRTLRLLSV